jgi:uncharacterized protein (TIGR00251 family)
MNDFVQDIKDQLSANGKCVIEVIVKSDANKAEIKEVLENNVWKIDVAAPPINGQANRALIIFLSSLLVIHRNQLKIIRGTASKHKLVMIINT